MITLPEVIITLMYPFERLFHPRTWRKAQLLMVGAILAPGKRTVTSALHVLGMSQHPDFSLYHHVLNRARWSHMKLSQVLLHMLIAHLDSEGGPLVFGIDETIERRRGRMIAARGVYRDGVRSSHSHLVKVSGLRWVSLMWLAHIPWAGRHWALPFLTALAPSQRCHQRMGRRHKTLTDFARQMLLCLRRWLPDRDTDSSYSVMALLSFCQRLSTPITFITRLRMDASLHEPAPPRRPGQMGRPRLVGQRLPRLAQLLDDPTTSWTTLEVNWYDSTIRTLQIASDTAIWYNRGKPAVPIRWTLIRDPLGELNTQALLCTSPDVEPIRIIQWFVLRWQVEVTFQELRAHIGVETQRQWSAAAIARTTPALFGLFSWVCLAACVLGQEHKVTPRSSAWYDKPAPTFADAIAITRRCLWSNTTTFATSHGQPDMLKVPRPLYDRMLDSLCYAA